MPESIKLVEWAEPKRYAYIDHVGPYFLIGDAFARLFSLPGILDVASKPPLTLAVWMDDPDVVAADELRSRAGVFVDDDAVLPAGCREDFIVSSRFVRKTHTGAYSGLPEAWRFLYSVWLPHSGERVRGVPGFEIYVKSPGEVPTEELVTEMYIALK